MKSRLLFVTLLCTIGFTFQKCCTCDDFESEFFDILGMHLEHSYSGLERDSILYEDYAYLTVIYDVDYVYQECPHFSLSTMPSAYGCSCKYNGQEGSMDEALSNVTVITLNDFDQNHLANDTINDLIDVVEFREEPIDLALYLANIQNNIFSESLNLSLDKAPTLNPEFQVRVRIDLSTGERYEAISEAITFQ